jgi:hypothetical protein
MKTLLKSFGQLVIVIFISIIYLGCSDDDPIKEEIILQNCEENIDRTIVFDTIWKVDAKSHYLFTQLYNQKYFATTEHFNTFDIYSVEKGEHLIETPGNPFIDFRNYEIQISGDYCILFDFHTQLYMFHDILNDETIKKKFLDDVNTFTVDSANVYFSTLEDSLNYIIRRDFELTFSDTICAFNYYENLYNAVLFLPKNDSEKLIYISGEYPLVSIDIINLNDKTIYKHLEFEAIDYRHYYSKLRNDFLLISMYGTFISVDLNDDFQIFHKNDSEIPHGFSQNISIHDPISDYESITLLTDCDKIQAFDQKHEGLIWSCEHPGHISYLSSIFLTKQDGEKEEFVIVNEADSYIQLLDPETGIIKSKIENKPFNRINDVYDDQSFIALDFDNQLYKLKIRREN